MNEEATREMTYGEKAVGLTFNPSGDPLVQSLKEKAAAFIDEAHAIYRSTNNPAVARMVSVAITEAQSAQMWAVKAATWRY